MRHHEARDEKIRALYAADWTYTQIAEELRISRNVVAGVVNRSSMVGRGPSRAWHEGVVRRRGQAKVEKRRDFLLRRKAYLKARLAEIDQELRALPSPRRAA